MPTRYLNIGALWICTRNVKRSNKLISCKSKITCVIQLQVTIVFFNFTTILFKSMLQKFQFQKWFTKVILCLIRMIYLFLSLPVQWKLLWSHYILYLHLTKQLTNKPLKMYVCMCQGKVRRRVKERFMLKRYLPLRCILHTHKRIFCAIFYFCHLSKTLFLWGLVPYFHAETLPNVWLVQTFTHIEI